MSCPWAPAACTCADRGRCCAKLLPWINQSLTTRKGVVVLCVTNLLLKLDVAFLRRFPKTLKMSVPDVGRRLSILVHAMEGYERVITGPQLGVFAWLAHGASCADLVRYGARAHARRVPKVLGAVRRAAELALEDEDDQEQMLAAVRRLDCQRLAELKRSRRGRTARISFDHLHVAFRERGVSVAHES